jgi:hypothetical protein
MRCLLVLSALCTLASPVAAWSGPPEAPRAVTTARQVLVRSVTSLQASPKFPAPGAIVADPATLCETAVSTAEYVHRLPPHLLNAISLAETGRLDSNTGRMRAWPWTLNAEGEGRYFETAQQAVVAVRALQARGVRSIDVGCLQINLMFHPNAFASLEDAFDPRGNADYAARFLNSLYAIAKEWAPAIGAYHSETPALGDAYRVLVMARWQNGDTRAETARPAAYRDFAARVRAESDQRYGAFAPSSRVYGAFAPR